MVFRSSTIVISGVCSYAERLDLSLGSVKGTAIRVSGSGSILTGRFLVDEEIRACR